MLNKIISIKKIILRGGLMKCVFAVLTLFLAAKKVNAQYFGQNKVSYENFNWRELHTENFDIYFYPEEQEAIKYAGRMAERWHARDLLLFLDTLNGRQPLILYYSFPQFRQTSVTQGLIGQGTGGFTEPLKRRIVLPFAGPLKETNHVIGHELVHAFQYDITKSVGPGAVPIGRIPLWFIEGMAEYFSLGPNDPFTAMWMRDAALKELPDISDLNSPEYFPYRYGQALLAFIGGKYGDDKLIEILTTADTLNIEAAIDSVLNVSLDSLSNDWHAAIHEQYDPIKKTTKTPLDYGSVLISGEEDSEALNVSPVLSPDGENLAFYSSRDLFSINIFLADAETGEIKRTILETALDPHLSSLNFIKSAGAWNPQGTKFIFSATKKGRPSLSILNITSNEIENEIRFDNLGEILNPSWSPDGKSIVFSALSNGLTDIFIYNFNNRDLKKITNNAYADLQPQWSPDGKKIAFVTDMFTTNLNNLEPGNYQIALLDPETGTVRQLKNFSKAKNINPQWSADGKSIYFLSDKNGITNIYELELSTENINQVTNLYGGVSGITSLSPALSAASGKIVYSAYKNGKYSIYSIDKSKVNPKETVKLKNNNAGILPPEKRANDLLVDLLNNPNIGLPSGKNFYTTDYNASLSLTGVIQPSIGVGVSTYGTNIGGGVGLFWTDMLGNHNLFTAFQIQSYRSFKFTDITAFVQYLNTSSRWNWGGLISQIPSIFSNYNVGYGTIQGESVFFEEQQISKQISRGISGLISYPFSQVMRVEFSAGYQNISFTNEIITRVISLRTGEVIRDETQDLAHPSALNLASLSSALVFDNSIFGATSPLLGQRFRFEVNPTFGSLNLINLLADFRKYLMPIRPFTLAGRILHLGRYAGDAEDNRLTPLFIGYPGLVRGYQSGSYNATEFLTDPGNNLNFNELFGSKMLIGNFELRFPLFGALGIGSGFYGFFPIEFGVFYDAGTAWTSSDKPKIFGGDRNLITSFGGLLRINLFGFAVAEVDYVHPFNRPGDKWLWQFNLIQGF